MEELKELIERKAQERFNQHPARHLLQDVKFYIEEDAKVSASLGIQPMSPRQIIKTLLERDQKEEQRRYNNISSVEWAWNQMERLDPEYIKTIKRKYGKTEEGDDSQN